MKNSSLIRRLALVVSALIAVSLSARATQVPQYNSGDLLLGFYDYSGSVTNDYLVDLGPIANFNLHANFVILSSTSHMGTDLVHVFGSSWFTNGNIVFGLAASFPLTGQIYVSNPNDGTPWTEEPAQGTPAGQITNAGNAYSLSTQSNSEQDPRGLEQADGATNSWDAEATSGFGNFFGSGGDGEVSDFVSNSLEFDRVNEGTTGTPGIDLGSFSLDSAGDLTFSAVPEPSAFATVGVGAVLLLVFKRRARI